MSTHPTLTYHPEVMKSFSFLFYFPCWKANVARWQLLFFCETFDKPSGSAAQELQGSEARLNWTRITPQIKIVGAWRTWRALGARSENVTVARCQAIGWLPSRRSIPLRLRWDFDASDSAPRRSVSAPGDGQVQCSQRDDWCRECNSTTTTMSRRGRFRVSNSPRTRNGKTRVVCTYLLQCAFYSSTCSHQ